MYAVINYAQFDEFKSCETVQFTPEIRAALVENLPDTFTITSSEQDPTGAILIMVTKKEDEKDTKSVQRYYFENTPLAYIDWTKKKEWKDLVDWYKQQTGFSIVLASAVSQKIRLTSDEAILFINMRVPGYRSIGNEEWSQFNLPKIQGQFASYPQIYPKCVTVKDIDKKPRIIMQGTSKMIYVYPEGSGTMDSVIELLREYAVTPDAPIPENRSESVKIFDKLLNSKFVEIQKTEEDASKRYKELTKEVVEQARTLQRIEIAKKALGEWKATSEEDVTNAVDKIKALPLVHNATINNGVFIVDTLPITGKVKKDLVLFGRYRIFINIANGAIDINNFDIMYANHAHPHHMGSGNICFGNNSGEIAALIGQFELTAAVDIMIAFLSSANTADQAGATVCNWPIVEKGVIKLRNNSITILNSNIYEGASYDNYAQNLIY